MTIKQSYTPPKYRHTLIADGNMLRLETPPTNWKDGEFAFNRDLDIGGIFPEYNVDSLTFIKEGRQFLNTLFENYWSNASCEYLQEWFDPEINDYVEFPSRFKIEFKDWSDNPIGGELGLTVPVTKQGLISTFQVRRNQIVDATKTVAINGYNIIDYVDLLKNVNIPAIYSFFQGNFTGNYNIRFSGQNSILGLENIIVNDFQSGELSETVDGSVISVDNAFFNDSSNDKGLNLNGNITVTLNNAVNRPTISIIAQKYNASGILIEELILVSYKFKPAGETITIEWSEDISVLSGESISCSIGLSGAVLEEYTGTDMFMAWTELNFNVSERIERIPAVKREGFPIYEAFERVLQLILGKQYPFYSEYLGRTDTPYNLNGDVYLSENQETFVSFFSGNSLRNVALSNSSNPLALSFDKLFQMGQCTLDLGAGVEKIDGEERIVIEQYNDFFTDELIFDFSNELNQLDIKRQIVSSLIYSSVETGYENYDYEQNNGRGEYNTKQLRTTIAEVENKFDNVCGIRGDVMGLIKELQQDVTQADGTTDSKGDNDTFLIKTQRHSSLDEWIAETDENIEVLESSSLFKEGSLNLLFTPFRNMVRTSSRWSIGLVKQLSSSIRFQYANKSQTLKTKSDIYTARENDDVQIGNPYFTRKPKISPIYLEFEVDFDFKRLQYLTATEKRKYGYIKVTPKWDGYIKQFTKKNAENKAKFKLILKYAG